ncbi:MAG: SDR family oxidoreductase [Lachnospiraceae bacterium]|nr:SDR family oxidoreductase [Lachnospiraceae bacterium]
MGDLSGKNVIITGSTRGIGRSILELFARNGANIWACARTRNDDFESEIHVLSEKHHVWITPIYFDLFDEDSVKKGIQQIIREKKPIDVLVNNAGMAYGGLATMTPVSKLKEIFQINYFAQVQIMQLILHVMIRQKSGSIVNMASIGGIETASGYLAYGSSKAALIYATKSCSHEVGEYGIRVNAIAPGLVETDMGGFKSDEEIQKILNRSSLHRKADPYEIANCALFLASDKSSFITGQTLIADGGRICV